MQYEQYIILARASFHPVDTMQTTVSATIKYKNGNEKYFYLPQKKAKTFAFSK